MAARKKTAKTKPTKTTRLSKGNTTRRKTTKSQVESATVETPRSDVRVNKKFGSRNVRIVIALGVIAGILYLLKGVFVVALINNIPVSRIEVIKELEKRYGQQVADKLITNKLILQEARKQGKLATNEQVEEELNKIKASVEAQGMTFENALSLQGTSEAEVRNSVLVYKSAQNLIADTISVSDDEVLGYYDENKALYEDQEFEDVKDDIKSQLMDQKLQSELFAYIQELKTNSDIQYFVEY